MIFHIFLALILFKTLWVCASGGQGSCRTVALHQDVAGKEITQDIFLNTTSPTIDRCEVLCYEDPYCNSFNFKPASKCQLSSANHETHRNTLKLCQGCVYRAFKSACVGVTCPLPNMFCQTGFGGPQRHRCVCARCYRGRNCEIKESQLQFPVTTHEKKISFQDKKFNVSAITVSVWLQNTKMNALYQSVVSIATAASSNAFLLLLHMNQLWFIRKSGIIQQNVQTIFDGAWHHVTASWSTAGNFALYVDGEIVKQQSGIHVGSVITQGLLVLGQEQDSYGGGFEYFQSYKGNLLELNIWNRVLSQQEIAAIAKKCEEEEVGNVINWQDVVSRESGITLACASRCSR